MKTIINKVIVFYDNLSTEKYKDAVLHKEIDLPENYIPSANTGIKDGKMYDFIASTFYDINEKYWIINLKTSEFSIKSLSAFQSLVNKYLTLGFEAEK